MIFNTDPPIPLQFPVYPRSGGGKLPDLSEAMHSFTIVDTLVGDCGVVRQSELLHDHQYSFFFQPTPLPPLLYACNHMFWRLRRRVDVSSLLRFFLYSRGDCSDVVRCFVVWSESYPN